MTFPEFIASRATWFDRLRCRVFGHVPGDWLGCLIERIGRWGPHCHRCGKALGVKP